MPVYIRKFYYQKLIDAKKEEKDSIKKEREKITKSNKKSYKS